MSPAVFEERLFLVVSHISKMETKLRQSISPNECLCITLQYHFTGDAFVTIGACLPWLFNIMLNFLTTCSVDILLLLKLSPLSIYFHIISWTINNPGYNDSLCLH